MQIPRTIWRIIVSTFFLRFLNFQKFRAMDGHPTMFMKILHYVLFYSSNAVRNYLYSKEIDPLTIHLNDYKFMERMFYIIVSSLISLMVIFQFRRTFLVSNPEFQSTNSSSTGILSKRWWCAWMLSIGPNRWLRKSESANLLPPLEKWLWDNLVPVAPEWAKLKVSLSLNITHLLKSKKTWG